MTMKRPLGDPDAMQDKGFPEHFVSSGDLDAILNNSTMVIYGSKGSGKSALRRALTEINKKFYCAAGTIDFDDISFAQVYSDLEKINKTTQAEIPLVARAAWRNVLALFVVELISDTLAEGHNLRKRIRSFLATHRGLKHADTNNRLLAWIEKIFARIEEYALVNEATFAGLSPDQRMEAVAFPGVAGLTELLKEAADHCRALGKHALVCLDGFDSIVDHTPESRSAIFAGLIDAIDRNRTDPIFEGAICFKAFLPAELTEDAHLLLWDADKRPLNFTHRLHWSIPEFHDFVAKRLAPFTRTRGASFRENWSEIFPVTVHNKTYDVEEDTFMYILRHTLHRPRHALIQLQRLLDEWDAKGTSTKIDPHFIPPVVSRTNADLAEKTVDQLSRRMPSIYSFVWSFRNSLDVIPQPDFVQRLRKHFSEHVPAGIDLIAKELYDLGLFGIALPEEERYESGRGFIRCRFGSIGPRQRGRILQWEATDLIAISPMLHEFCGLKESNHGAIVPFVGAGNH
jgi:hypothetical protein